MVVELANRDYSYAIAQAGSGNDNLYSLTISKFAFTDIQNKVSLAFAAKITTDQQAGEGSFTVTNAKYSTADYLVGASKFADTISLEELAALPTFHRLRQKRHVMTRY